MIINYYFLQENKMFETITQGALINLNGPSIELLDDISDWLELISSDRSTFHVTRTEYINILNSVDDYLIRFREEFPIDTCTTIKQAEETLIRQLESHMNNMMEQLKEVISEAKYVIKDITSEDQDIDFHLDFCHCTDPDELLEFAQEDWDEADGILESVEIILAEIESLNKKVDVAAYYFLFLPKKIIKEILILK